MHYSFADSAKNSANLTACRSALAKHVNDRSFVFQTIEC